MSPFSPSPELRHLVDRSLDGETLGRVDAARLETLLTDDVALDWYVGMTRQEALLPRALAQVGGAEHAPTPLPHARRRWRQASLAASAAALALGLGLGATRWLAPDVPADKSPPAAQATAIPQAAPQASEPVRISGMVGVESDEAGEILTDGGPAPDRLRIRTGLLELTYASGVRLTLEGPADLGIRGASSAELRHGKLVAFIPPGAEGFTVDYPGGRVVDLGTEFALSVGREGMAELAVFEGKVELHHPQHGVLALEGQQALQVASGSRGGVESVPLDRENYVRRLPNRDFRWELREHGPVTQEFDVSHLVWRGADFRAIFKWMHGPDAVRVGDVELLLDGRVMSRASGVGATGHLEHVRGNLFALPLEPEAFRRGRWTVRASLWTMERNDEIKARNPPVHSVGIMQFEEGLVSTAGPEDFIGSWRYHHEGNEYVRTFFPNGGLLLSINGQPWPAHLSQQIWTIRGGELHIDIPLQNGGMATEIHVLRDPETLIFASNPYANAKRIRSD